MYQAARYALLGSKGYQAPSAPTETASWVAQVVTNGGSVSAGRQSLVSALIGGLKVDGIWTKLDRLWLFAAENSQSALTDMKGLSLASAVNSPTFTTDRGYNGNGSTSYINSGYNPASGTNFAQTSAHAGGWVNVVDSTAASTIVYGGNNGSNYNTVLYRDGGGAGASQNVLNGATSSRVGFTTGHHVETTAGSTTLALFLNGGSKQTASVTFVAVPSATVYICAQNAGGASAFSQHRISTVHFGGQLSDAEVAAFYSRLQTYMTAVGA